MNVHDATETAYKNGFENGKKYERFYTLGLYFVSVYDELPKERGEYAVVTKDFKIHTAQYIPELKRFEIGKYEKDEIVFWSKLPRLE